MITPKKPPYDKTTADPDRTEMQINKLLRQYGIDRYQWNKDLKNSQVSLTFEAEGTIQGVKKILLIKVTPPTFAAKRKTWNAEKGTYQVEWLANWAQSYRLLFYWLKAKIEAIAYGLTTVEQEFLSQIVIKLPDGGMSTVGEQLESLSSQFALAAPTKTERLE